MFADWLEFASAFSIFLENEISYITRGNKQLNLLEISFTGYLAPTQQSKRKRNLTFSDRRNELNSRRDRTQVVNPFPASHAQRTFWVFPDLVMFPSPSALSLLKVPIFYPGTVSKINASKQYSDLGTGLCSVFSSTLQYLGEVIITVLYSGLFFFKYVKTNFLCRAKHKLEKNQNKVPVTTRILEFLSGQFVSSKLTKLT